MNRFSLRFAGGARAVGVKSGAFVRDADRTNLSGAGSAVESGGRGAAEPTGLNIMAHSRTGCALSRMGIEGVTGGINTVAGT